MSSNGNADGWELRDRWSEALLDLLQRLRKVPRPAQTAPTGTLADRREATPERSPRRVRRTRGRTGQGRRAAARPADVEGRQPSA